MNETEKMVNCIYCHELISSKAKKCKHCGEIVDQQMRDIERLMKEKNNQNIIVSNNNNNNNNLPLSIPSKKRFPHIAHAIMSFLTGGIWIFVWIIHYIFRDKNSYS